MSRGVRVEATLSYSQTLELVRSPTCLIEVGHRMRVLSGPILVSRTGDAG